MHAAGLRVLRPEPFGYYLLATCGVVSNPQCRRVADTVADPGSCVCLTPGSGMGKKNRIRILNKMFGIRSGGDNMRGAPGWKPGLPSPVITVLRNTAVSLFPVLSLSVNYCRICIIQYN